MQIGYYGLATTKDVPGGPLLHTVRFLRFELRFVLL